MHKPSFAKLILLPPLALIFALALPVRAEEEPAPVRRVDRRIASDETAVKRESTVRAEQKRVAKPAAKIGARKSSKLVKTPSKANLKADPTVKIRREETTKKKSADSLSLQNSAAVGTEVTTPGTANAVPSLSTTGGLGATSAGRAVGRDVTSTATATATAPAGTILPPSQTDSQMLPLLLQGLQGLFGARNSDSAQSKLDEAEEQARLISNIEKANALNQQVKDFTNTPVPVSDYCSTCAGRQTTDARFDACDQGKGYLEDLLVQSKNPALEPENTNRNNVSCIADSLRQAPTNNFLACANSRTAGDPKSVRPCASELMTKTLASAFELTSDCLAEFVDPEAASDMNVKKGIRRNLFQVVNHESHWAINAISPTGAAGLGQFTDGAIQTYNTTSFMRATEIIKNSSNESCKKLAKVNYEHMRTNQCSAISFENGNPQLMLIYTLMHMQDARDRSRMKLSASGLQISAETRRRVLEALSIWGHNVGTGGIAEIFEGTLAVHGKLLESGNVDLFLANMQNNVAMYHRKQNLREARVQEATGFYANTVSDMGKRESVLNGECGVY